MLVGGRTVNLGNIVCPVLSVLAENDTIAPPKSSEMLHTLIKSSDNEIMRFPVGHIGLSTSSKGPKIHSALSCPTGLDGESVCSVKQTKTRQLAVAQGV